MVEISDCCQCCDSKAERDEVKKKALGSVQMLYSTEGKSYYPDVAGTVTVPLPTSEDLIQLRTDKANIAELREDVKRLDGVDAGLKAEIDALTVKEAADVSELKSADTAISERVADNADQIATAQADLQATEAAVAANQSKIADIEAESAAIAKSLVSDVLMTDGTTAGSVQVSIEREDGALITSKNYAWGKSIGCRLEAGTQEGYIKTLIDLSDGTTIESNEYKIVEVLESDVYVTAITLVPDTSAGTIGGTISYSNGTTQAINAVSVPTAPGVTSAIEALQTRMTSAEQKNTTQDASIQSLSTRVKAIEDTPGVGQFGAGKLGTIAGSGVDGRVKAEDDGTGSVNGWATVKADVSQLKTSDAEHTETLATQASQISAQATEISEVKSTQAQLQNAIGDCFNDVSISGNVLTLTAVDGQSNSISLPTGESWTEVDLNNFPSDWKEGEEVKVEILGTLTLSPAETGWNNAITSINWSQSNNVLFSTVLTLSANTTYPKSPTYTSWYGNVNNFTGIIIGYINSLNKIDTWNQNPYILMSVNFIAFNGVSTAINANSSVGASYSSDYIKVYRKT